MNLGDLFGRRTHQQQLTPEESFVRVDEDLIEVAEKLKPFMESEAFRILVQLIQARRHEVATQALEDDSKSKNWWQGYHSGTGSIEEIVRIIVEQAQVAREEQGVEEVVSQRMPTSGGDLSIE